MALTRALSSAGGAGCVLAPKRLASAATLSHAQPEDVEDALAKVTQSFRHHFLHRLSKPRTIGREAEFPVVDADTLQAGDVRALLTRLDAEGDLRLKQTGDVGVYGPSCEYSLEVGHGTVEVIMGPCDDLHQLRDVSEASVMRLAAAAEDIGQALLGFGSQPVTPPSIDLMTPRQRYHAMLSVLGRVWMQFTVTASDQVHVDITQDELLRMINVTNLAAPFLVALCGNSSLVGGQAAPWVAAREGFWCGTPHDARIGVPDGPFYSVADYITSVCQLPMLLRPRTQREEWDGAEYLQPCRAGETYYDHMGNVGFDWESFLVHNRYVWHAGRPRTAQRTIEIRPMCQQPWEDHMVASALSLGLVEAAADVVHHPDLKYAMDWSRQIQLYPDVCRDGLAATCADFDLHALLTVFLDMLDNALANRKRGEERYLAPLHARLAARTNPGQAVVQAAEADSVDAAVRALFVSPP